MVAQKKERSAISSQWSAVSEAVGSGEAGQQKSGRLQVEPGVTSATSHMSFVDRLESN